jgi:FKBP-type peptidyl-prolyl cis-trans isomerase FklB
MKRLHSIFSLVLCSAVCASIVAAAEFKSELEKNSYAVGVNVARKLSQQGVSFDATALAQGVKDEMQGKSRLTADEIGAALQQLQNEATKKQAAERQKLGEENKKRGAAFLAEYMEKDGVKTLPSGTRYRVLQAGSGAKPAPGDSVICHYRGTRVDGTQFDASAPGKPKAFALERVIEGWREALQEMPVGSKWELVIPADLAYGEAGRAPAIGPHETLIFEVELVGIE